jgi:hypothetical protein
LPLGGERSWLEETIETESVLSGLAKEMTLDSPLRELSYHATDGKASLASERLKELSLALAAARGKADQASEAQVWQETSEFFYAWDARIQDILAIDSFAVASGYQLGRALAEINWALDPAATGTTTPESYDFLLGSDRLAVIERLATRLSGFFLPLTATAIVSSVTAWSRLAAKDVELRARVDTVAALHLQTRIWHDLLLTGQPPLSLVGHPSLLRRGRRIWPVVRAFVPEISLGLLSLVASAGAAYLFLGQGHNPALAGVLAVLGFFGVTGSGAAAKVKNQANALLAELQIALDLDLVKEGATVAVAQPYLDYEVSPSLGHALTLKWDKVTRRG